MALGVLKNRNVVPRLLFGATVALLLLAAPCAWAGESSSACRLTATDSAPQDGSFAAALAQGSGTAFLLTWLAGLAVALTPCVYPMIAVTVSVFGARKTKSRLEGVALSGAFVLGIVTLLVPLGVTAAKTGAIMGQWLSSPWVFVALAVLLLGMAASMFGAFDLELPASLGNRLANVGGTGYRGAFALGLVTAVVATPCTGPFLTGLLTWIAESQHVALGALMMLGFALGLGGPFFVVGAFAIQLPKSGKWMLLVKNLLGIVLVVAALYFLASAFPVLTSAASPDALFLILSAVGALAGFVLLAVASRGDSRARRGLKWPGVVAASVGSLFFIAGATKPTGTLAWQALTLEEGAEKARAERRPLLLDFTASWCFACKELDRFTFSDPRVAQEMGRFVAVKVDLSDDAGPVAEKSRAVHRVVGLPTVLLFGSDGREAVRCNDFVPAADFLEFARQVN